ncbi:hypothetical protein ACFPT7_03195 [Acidicapsa dinghuensis]|uniref:DUF5668 domain-containing protein n=1 Tax=Acidicapsa dinghuensis TaxID=2218256 RepID=A0ABW1EAB6_9BACT|nr:hypothetical protein [Acidicapsa dinghuensis]
MNRYLMVCRLRWPALLLLTGIIALLNQMDVLSWGHAWPLYLILLGVLALAERAALAAEPVPPAGYPPYGYDPGVYPTGGPQYATVQPAANPAPEPRPGSTGIVPANTDLGLSANEPRKSWDQEER